LYWSEKSANASACPPGKTQSSGYSIENLLSSCVYVSKVESEMIFVCVGVGSGVGVGVGIGVGVGVGVETIHLPQTTGNALILRH